jgi:EAL domain-containing protein (putative c-di-GMP-specific phosphodiesterase class I)
MNQTTATIDNIKSERDRFVALSFCWADFLLELDADKKIVFSAGALPISTSPGKSTDFVGSLITDLVTVAHRPLVERLLDFGLNDDRIDCPNLQFNSKNENSPYYSVTGYRLEDLENHYFLAFRQVSISANQFQDGAGNLDDDVVDVKAFSAAATDKIRTMLDKGEEVSVTLMQFPNFSSLHDRLDSSSEKRLSDTVRSYLNANSANGDGAGKISDGKYSLVHQNGLDIDQMSAQLQEITSSYDPLGEGVSVESATIDVDGAGISDEDIAQGLLYTMRQFRDSSGTDFTIGNLSNNFTSLVSDVLDSVKSFKEIVANGDFFAAFQPIIDVNSGEIHHYEALARFNAADRQQSPYEYITFAEETGLIWEFDIAMVKKVLTWMAKSANRERSVAVNVSGYSIGNLHYSEQLNEMLYKHPWSRGRLMFEITESAQMSDLESANKFIQSVRNSGYKVCLDDFGAGSASFQYLSVLEVDIVKLDGSAVRNAQVAPKGRAFFSALTSLCHNLDVGTVAEMIDSPNSLKFVRECGVQSVQGFLFGRPSENVETFDPLPQIHMFPNRRK